jgi:hypothetical protein
MTHPIKTAIALALCLSVNSTLSGQQSGNDVQLEVMGAPVPAKETGRERFYKAPKPHKKGDIDGRDSQMWSMLGREDKAAAGGDSEYRENLCPDVSPTIQGYPNIIEEIVKRAANHRIVIISESHVVSRHRDFIRQILPGLRKNGFTVYAAETFFNSKEGSPIEHNSTLPWPIENYGWYLNEPTFGRLIRSAKSLGYKFAAYEQLHEHRSDTDDRFLSIEKRETAQANNLAKILAKMGHNERMIVHVGYSHVYETPVKNDNGQEIKWMAARLKALTGLDPLTISQTVCQTSGQSPRLVPAPSPVLSQFDMAIEHPVERFSQKRLSWRTEAGDQPVPIPPALRPKTKPYVIEAFADGEPVNAVPIDRVYVEAGENIPLMLPPGRYRVRAVKAKRVLATQ